MDSGVEDEADVTGVDEIDMLVGTRGEVEDCVDEGDV